MLLVLIIITLKAITLEAYKIATQHASVNSAAYL